VVFVRVCPAPLERHFVFSERVVSKSIFDTVAIFGAIGSVRA
jgi:hypothetical protein